MIKVLDEGLELSGKTYKNYNLAIRKWKANEKNWGNGKRKTIPADQRTETVNEFHYH
jgi:hypothetical protein